MKRSLFYKFFPPPQFLQMPVVGLDISDVSLRFIELTETRKGLTIGRFGEHDIPKGTIESGTIKNVTVLRDVLIDLKKKYNLGFVSVSLPEEKAYLFDLELPKMKYAELRGAIELQVEDHVPLKASEVIFDYEIIGEDASTIKVNISVLPRALVDSYLEAFSETGITPVALEIEVHSIMHAVIPPDDEHAYMVVDFGRTRTGIFVAEKGAVLFTSTVPVGGDALTNSIAKNLNISHDEAEKVKREKGVTDRLVDENLSLALMSMVSILRDEIAKHHTYWATHEDEYGKKRQEIHKIYLCGGEANLLGLRDYLAEGFSVPIEMANVLTNVNSLERYVPEISFYDSLRYATAIGLALRHLK
ncbi:MAG: Type IV pilus assembly protein PilM [Parcubacteria group bacterium GW2011_GWA1_47_8]|nr:MAG: Type IV pilus assembly protein PilM [Parcubacteria group bacterium GW2011_GWA1_47_8]